MWRTPTVPLSQAATLPPTEKGRCHSAMFWRQPRVSSGCAHALRIKVARTLLAETANRSHVEVSSWRSTNLQATRGGGVSTRATPSQPRADFATTRRVVINCCQMALTGKVWNRAACIVNACRRIAPSSVEEISAARTTQRKVSSRVIEDRSIL